MKIESLPPDRPRIVISGVGLLTPLGHSAWETFTALLAGRTLADRAAELPEDIAATDLVRAVGCVRVAQHAGSDPAVELAERAAREALMEAGAAADQTPMYVGSSKGAMHALSAAVDRHGAAAAPGRQRYTSLRDAELAVALGPHGYLSHHLRQRLGVPIVRQMVAACASSLTALHAARMSLLGAGPGPQPQRVLVCTSEAALLPMFIASYRRLGVLPPLHPGQYTALPLDERRCGFMLTEAAAAVVLQRLEADQQPTAGQIELLDTAIAAEAFDIVRPPPTMLALRHVAQRLLTGRAIDMLHPHATGTATHDEQELAVYESLLHGQDVPALYACKGALGHALGAAGLAALVLACLCARTQRRPTMPWLKQPVHSPLVPGRDAKVGHMHAIFCAGFGGHVAGAVIDMCPRR